MCFKVSFQDQVAVCILMAILPWTMANTCRPRSYTIAERNGTFLKCMDCVECPDMYGATVPCNTMVYHDTNIGCVLCDLGKTFSLKYNEHQCQLCKSATCHDNEEWVGVCTLTVDNTRCNGTCIKGYYWNKNQPDQPCQPLNHPDNLFTNLYTATTTFMSLANMTDGGQSSNYCYLVIKIVIPIIFIICVGLVLCWARRKYLKKREHSIYAPCQRAADDVELSNIPSTDVTDASRNDDSTNVVAEDRPPNKNNTEIQETELLSKCSDPLPMEYSIVDELFSENVELNPHHGASASLSTPGGTPTPKHKESSSRDEQDLRKNLLSKNVSAPFTVCKVETHRIDNMNPNIYRKLCQLLDLDLAVGDNYETLASHLGYVKIDLDIAGNQKKETTSRVLLDDWGKKCSGNTVLALEKIVREKMKRFDVLEELAKELKLQRDQCNCGNCSEIPLSVEKPDT